MDQFTKYEPSWMRSHVASYPPIAGCAHVATEQRKNLVKLTAFKGRVFCPECEPSLISTPCERCGADKADAARIVHVDSDSWFECTVVALCDLCEQTEQAGMIDLNNEIPSAELGGRVIPIRPTYGKARQWIALVTQAVESQPAPVPSD